jgi:hypothetical protein
MMKSTSIIEVLHINCLGTRLINSIVDMLRLCVGSVAGICEGHTAYVLFIEVCELESFCVCIYYFYLEISCLSS